MKTLRQVESPAAPLLLPDLQGRTAVVTGVSMGIGRATAELLPRLAYDRVEGLDVPRRLEA